MKYVMKILLLAQNNGLANQGCFERDIGIDARMILKHSGKKDNKYIK